MRRLLPAVLVAAALAACRAAPTPARAGLAPAGVRPEPAAAPAPDAAPARSSGPAWRLTVAPYLWVLDFEGRLDAGPLSVDTGGEPSGGLSQIGNDAPFGFNGIGSVQVEARRDRVGVLLDTTYMSLLKDGRLQVTGVPARTEIAVFLLELDGAWRPWEAPVDLVAGARYSALSLDTEAGALSARARTEVVAPVVGARAELPLGRAFVANVRGDVGGFGLGMDSTWQALGLVGWRASECATVHLGYRALGVDLDRGGLAIDGTLHGWLLGARLTL